MRTPAFYDNHRQRRRHDTFRLVTHHDTLQKRTDRGRGANSHGVTEEKHADSAEWTGKDHEDESEFRLVCSPVLLAHPLDHSIRSEADEDATDHAADEGAGAKIADLRRIEHPGWAGEDTCKDDSGADIPAIQQARDQNGIAGGRIEQCEERTEKELEKAVV